MREIAAVDEFLRTAMRDRGWNVPRLAEACDVSVGLAAKWVSENPRYRVTPGPASCEKIADALGYDPDYVLALAGHRKRRPDQPQVDPVRSELDARLAKLGATLSKYPRAFWLAVVEASERLAEAGDALLLEPPVSDPAEGGVSSPGRGLKPTSRANKPPLAHRKPAPQLLPAGV